MELAQPCPCCGQPNALIALGVRYDHPHRWRPWVTTPTQLYLCNHCEALMAVGATHAPVVESTRGPSGSTRPPQRRRAARASRALRVATVATWQAAS